MVFKRMEVSKYKETIVLKKTSKFPTQIDMTLSIARTLNILISRNGSELLIRL